MKKKDRIQDEFYIGYLPQAPAGTARFIRALIAAAGVLTTGVCLLLAVSQQKFSDSVFEYGTLTDVEGILSLRPVPSLQVTDERGRITHALLLVGFGKSGALPAIGQLERLAGKTLDGQRVVLRGTRIYGHEKGLLQITAEDNMPVKIKPPPPFTAPHRSMTEHVTLTGEVVDPKCYFGVMKPGEGKPHRSCAVRCIAGGIPPVFAARTGGGTEYFVLTGEDLGETIIALVGEPVQLAGEVTAFHNWKVLKVEPEKIKTLVKQQKERAQPLPEDGITLCRNAL